MVEKALLVLAKPVIVLILGGNERRSDLIERLIRRPTIVFDIRIPIFVVRNRHGPAGHLQQLLSFGRCDRDVRGRR